MARAAAGNRMIRFYEPQNEVTQSYKQAMDLLIADQYEDALARLLSEPIDSPSYGSSQGNAALILLEQGKARQAAECAYASIEHFRRKGCSFPPSFVQSCRLLADAHAAQGNFAQAIEWFEEVCSDADNLCQHESEHAEAVLQEKAHALVSRGNAFLNLKQWQEAMRCYEQARTIYECHPSFDQAGVPQALGNLAIAASQLGDLTRADLALREALSIAKSQGDEDQVHRVLVYAVQIGSTLVREADRLATLVAAAAAAEQTGRLPSAITRFAIAAQYNLTANTAGYRLDFVIRAQHCASRLDGLTPDGCKLYTTEAHVRSARGDTPEEILPCLLRGAQRWHELFARNLHEYDSFAIASQIHEHFRWLADVLLSLGRDREALLAFEAGRALAHTRKIDQELVTAVLQHPLFLPEAARVDLTLLTSIQESLAAGTVVITINYVSGRFLVYSVRQDSVHVESYSTSDTQADLDGLVEEIRSIPYGLEMCRGISAIPAFVVTMAEGVCREVGQDTIVRFIPHSQLHVAPWRTLLHNAGATWDKLRFSTGFSLLSMASKSHNPDLSRGRVIGLGYDPDGNPAFLEEPREVAQLFGARGSGGEPCSELNVRNALSDATILDLSCHGFSRNAFSDIELILRLEAHNGRSVDVPLLQFCPERVCPALVILSACYSGAYTMASGDFPVGGAPLLLQRGACYCMVMRFSAGAEFAKNLVVAFARNLASGAAVEDAFICALAAMQESGADLWRDLACVELLSSR